MTRRREFRLAAAALLGAWFALAPAPPVHAQRRPVQTLGGVSPGSDPAAAPPASGRRDAARVVPVYTMDCADESVECRMTRALQSSLDPSLHASGADLLHLAGAGGSGLAAFICPCNEPACKPWMWTERPTAQYQLIQIGIAESNEVLTYLRTTERQPVAFRIKWSRTVNGSDPLLSEGILAYSTSRPRAPQDICRE